MSTTNSCSANTPTVELRYSDTILKTLFNREHWDENVETRQPGRKNLYFLPKGCSPCSYRGGNFAFLRQSILRECLLVKQWQLWTQVKNTGKPYMAGGATLSKKVFSYTGRALLSLVMGKYVVRWTHSQWSSRECFNTKAYALCWRKTEHVIFSFPYHQSTQWDWSEAGSQFPSAIQRKPKNVTTAPLE